MKLKDLESGISLGGIKVKTPDGKIGYLISQWDKVVWLSNKTNVYKEGKIIPFFINNLIETLEWKITDEEVNI